MGISVFRFVFLLAFKPMPCKASSVSFEPLSIQLHQVNVHTIACALICELMKAKITIYPKPVAESGANLFRLQCAEITGLCAWPTPDSRQLPFRRLQRLLHFSHSHPYPHHD